MFQLRFIGFQPRVLHGGEAVNLAPVESLGYHRFQQGDRRVLQLEPRPVRIVEAGEPLVFRLLARLGRVVAIGRGDRVVEIQARPTERPPARIRKLRDGEVEFVFRAGRNLVSHLDAVERVEGRNGLVRRQREVGKDRHAFRQLLHGHLELLPAVDGPLVVLVDVARVADRETRFAGRCRRRVTADHAESRDRALESAPTALVIVEANPQLPVFPSNLAAVVESFRVHLERDDFVRTTLEKETLVLRDPTLGHEGENGLAHLDWPRRRVAFRDAAGRNDLLIRGTDEIELPFDGDNFPLAVDTNRLFLGDRVVHALAFQKLSHRSHRYCPCLCVRHDCRDAPILPDWQEMANRNRVFFFKPAA